jgi:hypothetical protein
MWSVGGSFWRRARDRSSFAVMRELGLVTIFEDVNFAKIGTLFDEHGNLLDQNFIRRVDTFLNELIWMARVLRHGRQNIPEVKTE